MEFSRPEYWSGEPFPSPGDLPNPRIKPSSPALQADSILQEKKKQDSNCGDGKEASLLEHWMLGPWSLAP